MKYTITFEEQEDRTVNTTASFPEPKEGETDRGYIMADMIMGIIKAQKKACDWIGAPKVDFMTTPQNDEMEKENAFNAFMHDCEGRGGYIPSHWDGFRAGWAARGEQKDEVVGTIWGPAIEKVETFSERLNALRSMLELVNATLWRALPDDAHKHATEARLAILKAIADIVGGAK